MDEDRHEQVPMDPGAMATQRPGQHTKGGHVHRSSAAHL